MVNLDKEDYLDWMAEREMPVSPVFQDEKENLVVLVTPGSKANLVCQVLQAPRETPVFLVALDFQAPKEILDYQARDSQEPADHQALQVYEVWMDAQEVQGPRAKTVSLVSLEARENGAQEDPMDHQADLDLMDDQE